MIFIKQFARKHAKSESKIDRLTSLNTGLAPTPIEYKLFETRTMSEEVCAVTARLIVRSLGA
jgi:hypothetical protein